MPVPLERWPTGRLLSAIARRIERDWDTHLAQWDLTHASLPVLDLLSRAPRSQRELAEAMDVTEQTMSRIVARLERTGYVSREVHATDRRRHAVVLTPTGLAVLREAGDPAVAEELSRGGLAEADVVELRRILTLLLVSERADDGVPGDGRDGGAGSPGEGGARDGAR